MPKDTRPSQYDILFEPVRIGPKVAKNRFYQVPHCNGGGYRDPSAVAEMRRTKAEGGWGVIFTEQTEIHPSSEITPFIELRIWDEDEGQEISVGMNPAHILVQCLTDPHWGMGYPQSTIGWSFWNAAWALSSA